MKEDYCLARTAAHRVLRSSGLLTGVSVRLSITEAKWQWGLIHVSYLTWSPLAQRSNLLSLSLYNGCCDESVVQLTFYLLALSWKCWWLASCLFYVAS